MTYYLLMANETTVLPAATELPVLLAEVLSEVYPCGCISTPDHGYMPCPTCAAAMDAPMSADIIDAEFEWLEFDEETGEELLRDGDPFDGISYAEVF